MIFGALLQNSNLTQLVAQKGPTKLNSNTVGLGRARSFNLRFKGHISFVFAPRSRPGSVVFQIPGACPERVTHDVAHSQYLGTGKALNGSLLVVLSELGCWGELAGQPGRYDVNMQELLRLAHREFIQWKRRHKLCASQPRFTTARVSRKHRSTFPCLSSKAIASKTISYFLCEKACSWAERPGATFFEKALAVCVYAYCKVLSLMDEGEAIFTEEQAQEFYRMTMLHLQCYSFLHKAGQVAKGKEVGRNCFLLLPKLHYFYHLAVTTATSRINLRFCTLLSAESFVGKIGRIARRTHRSSLTLRTVEKYLAILYLHSKRNPSGQAPGRKRSR